jgi:hypothetical protein
VSEAVLESRVVVREALDEASVIAAVVDLELSEAREPGVGCERVRRVCDR